MDRQCDLPNLIRLKGYGLILTAAVHKIDQDIFIRIVDCNFQSMGIFGILILHSDDSPLIVITVNRNILAAVGKDNAVANGKLTMVAGGYAACRNWPQHTIRRSNYAIEAGNHNRRKDPTWCAEICDNPTTVSVPVDGTSERQLKVTSCDPSRLSALGMNSERSGAEWYVTLAGALIACWSAVLVTVTWKRVVYGLFATVDLNSQGHIDGFPRQ